MRDKENNRFLGCNYMKFNNVIIVEPFIIIIQGCYIIKWIKLGKCPKSSRKRIRSTNPTDSGLSFKRKRLRSYIVK